MNTYTSPSGGTAINLPHAETGLVTSYEEWLNRLYDAQVEWQDKNVTDVNAHKKIRKGNWNGKQADQVNKILACDLAHWMLRRTSGGVCDDSTLDALRAIKRQEIDKYLKLFKKPYSDFNDGEKIW